MVSLLADVATSLSGRSAAAVEKVGAVGLYVSLPRALERRRKTNLPERQLGGE
jgi:hypothetical protein